MARVTRRRRTVGWRPRCGSRAPRRAESRSSSTSGSGSRPGNIHRRARGSRQVGVHEIGADRIVDAGILHLHRDARRRATARCTCPIDAAAIGLRVPLREHTLGVVAEFLADHRRGELGRHGGAVLLQRRERVAHRLRQARRRGSSPSARSSSTRPSCRRGHRRHRRRSRELVFGRERARARSSSGGERVGPAHRVQRLARARSRRAASAQFAALRPRV